MLIFLFYFNPLHREGGDCCCSQHSFPGCTISIHSTARVETCCGRRGSRRDKEFQSTPPRGWRRGYSLPPARRFPDFNPLHREGGDYLIYSFLRTAAISIHSTARVETMALTIQRESLTFQSTPPRGWRPRCQMHL